MIRNFLIAIALLLTAACSTEARSIHGSGTVPPPAGCIPGALDNGCSGANPNSNFQISSATFAATAIGDGGTNVLATYSPNKNRAGIEYPVGRDTTIPLIDPVTATYPGGCSYNPAGVLVTGGATGPVVTCNTSGTVTLPNGLDFSGANSPSVNNCIPLRTLGNGNVLVNNANFKYALGSFCDGGWIKKDSNGQIIIKFSDFDGNQASGTNGAIPVSSNGSFTTDEMSIYYSYLHDVGARILNAARGFGNHFVYYNYIDNFGGGTSGAVLHGELGLFGGIGTTNSTKFQPQEYKGNTVIVPFGAPGRDITTIFYCNTGGTLQFATSCVADGNTIIINADSGGGAPVGAALFEEQWSGVDLVTLTNNDIYSHGAYFCGVMGAPTNTATASASGNIITVTAKTAIWTAGYKINQSGFTEATILPYGTSGTTGTGGTGTYAFDGPTQSVASSGNWHVTPPIGTFTSSNNLSLADLSANNPTYPLGNSPCAGHHP